MVKVADMLPTEPLGELGNSIHPGDAQDTAELMRYTLGADLWEEEKIQTIYMLNHDMGNEMLSAAWNFLNSKERRAWKAYLDQWRVQ